MIIKISVLIFTFLAFLSTGLAAAPQPAKVFQIGVVSPHAGLEPPHEVFRQRLRELGYIEGSFL
jgi:hypothetical protein